MDNEDLKGYEGLTNLEVFNLSKANPEFIDRIIGTVPENYNELEKVSYVYFKLCAVLNYDSKFWASRQTGSTTKSHLDYTNIEEYDEKNNEVVCFEFTNLFKKALDKMGIASEILDYHSDYGGHTDLAVKFPAELFDDKIVNEEAKERGVVKLVFNGATGMTHLKMLNAQEAQNSLEKDEVLYNLGIESNDFLREIDVRLNLRRNKDLSQEQRKGKEAEFKEDFGNEANKFFNVADKVIEEQKLEENRFNAQNEDLNNLENAENELKVLLGDNYKTWSNEEKIELFLYQVSKLNMADLPSIRYGLKLFKSIDKEDRRNYSYSMIREKQAGTEDVYNMVAVFAKEENGKFSYMKITPPNKIEPYSQEEMQKQFNDGSLSFIEEYEEEQYKILGINTPNENIKNFAKEMRNIDFMQKENVDALREKFNSLFQGFAPNNYRFTIVNFKSEHISKIPLAEQIDGTTETGVLFSSLVDGKWNYQLVRFNENGFNPIRVFDLDNKIMEDIVLGGDITYVKEVFDYSSIIPGAESGFVSNMLKAEGYTNNLEANFKALIENKDKHSETENKIIFEYLCQYSINGLKELDGNENLAEIYDQNVLRELVGKYGQGSVICDKFVKTVTEVMKENDIEFSIDYTEEENYVIQDGVKYEKPQEAENVQDYIIIQEEEDIQIEIIEEAPIQVTEIEQQPAVAVVEQAPVNANVQVMDMGQGMEMRH